MLGTVLTDYDLSSDRRRQYYYDYGDTSSSLIQRKARASSGTVRPALCSAHHVSGLQAVALAVALLVAAFWPRRWSACMGAGLTNAPTWSTASW